MQFKDLNLQEMIDNAEKNGACNTELRKLREFSSMKELLETASDEEKAEWAYWYARVVVQDRWLEAEPFIMKNAQWSYRYAKYVIQGRWMEAEKTIVNDAWVACLYAENIIQGRWIEAESNIMKEFWMIFWYTKYILKNRWLEAEPILKTDDGHWEKYCETFPDAAKE